MSASPSRVSGRWTLEDVAARAGVSRATASRVVNGGTRVAAATRAAVEQAVDELGYAPNRAARSLAGQSTDTVALVVSEPSTRMFADPFFAGTIRGIASGLRASRYQLVLLMTQNDADRHRVERHLLRGNADGVLLLSVRADDPIPPGLVEAGIPCVLAGRPQQGLQVGFVDADNEGGAYQAVRHLLQRGCRTVATVAGPADMAPGTHRLAGWHRAMAEADGPTASSLVARGDFTAPSGRAATVTLLERHPEVDGIFAASDLMAVGVLDALRQAGRRIPEDVAVVGFDDSELAPSSVPPLTTVRQPLDEMGRTMAELLVALLDGDADVEGVVLQTQLVVRESA
ncbi:MAG: LacI family DNA-binding transcriptional regulator [Acidimicrobiales bacterium]